MRDFVHKVLRASAYVFGISAALLAVSLPLAPALPAYPLTAAIFGAVTFPVVWWGWIRRAPVGLILVPLFTLVQMRAEKAFVPGAEGWEFWLHAIQFWSTFAFVHFALLHFFRHRILASMERQPSAA